MMKGGHQTVGCNHSMCDRQNINWKGCYGQSPTQWPIVLQCDVLVHDVKGFNKTDDGTASFSDFRSWRFSNFFFDSFASLENQNQDDFESFQSDMRREIKSMVAHVNTNGGWTIIGWHRRGVYGTAGEESEEMLANDTAGHISCLKPTKATAIENNEEYKKFAPPAPSSQNTQNTSENTQAEQAAVEIGTASHAAN